MAWILYPNFCCRRLEIPFSHYLNISRLILIVKAFYLHTYISLRVDLTFFAFLLPCVLNSTKQCLASRFIRQRDVVVAMWLIFSSHHHLFVQYCRGWLWSFQRSLFTYSSVQISKWIPMPMPSLQNGRGHLCAPPKPQVYNFYHPFLKVLDALGPLLGEALYSLIEATVCP